MSKRKSRDEWIRKYNRVHSSFYDYTLSVFKGAHDKIDIICPEHGLFSQKADNHLRQGCPECGRSKTSNANRINIKQRISNLSRKFGIEYCSGVYNISTTDRIEFMCKTHGKFVTTIDTLMHSLHGCSKCANDEVSIKNSSNALRFISSAKMIHGELYDYSRVEYKNSNTKVTIVCPVHGPFKMLPYNHISKHNQNGCKVCNKSPGGYNTNNPGILYIHQVTCNNEIIAYKFGITNNNNNSRLRSQNRKSRSDISVVGYKKYKGSGTAILALEQRIKSTMQTKFLLKEHLQDGYTETIPPDKVSELIQLIEDCEDVSV